ncbi:transposase [Komagataeibacter medellinensis]|nr:transposase [Komagataeibacter medellinensis]
MTDALGNLVRFTLISGQHYDTVGVAPLLGPVDSEGILADKAFDVHWIVDALHAQGACVVIPQRKNRLDRRSFDFTRDRCLMSNLFRDDLSQFPGNTGSLYYD